MPPLQLVAHQMLLLGGILNGVSTCVKGCKMHLHSLLRLLCESLSSESDHHIDRTRNYVISRPISPEFCLKAEFTKEATLMITLASNGKADPVETTHDVSKGNKASTTEWHL
jgi:hypothetical protein